MLQFNAPPKRAYVTVYTAQFKTVITLKNKTVTRYIFNIFEVYETEETREGPFINPVE